MTGVIPFAGLAPDSRAARGGGELTAFDLEAAVRLGRDLLGHERASTELAAALIDALNALEHEGRPAWVLLQILVTKRVPATTGSPRLTLLKSRGLDPEWNDSPSSSGDGAYALDLGTAPMVVELLRELRVGDAAQPAANTFYAADASTSAAVPPRSFITAYGVRSVVGFGLQAWPGESVVVVGFSRVLLERTIVRALEALALYTKLAWIETREASSALGEIERARLHALVLKELVRSHEVYLSEMSFEARARMNALRVEAERAAREGAEQVARQNLNLHRTQRAMLNVIEDLRDAREVLASKVEERTRDLAQANQELQSRNRELEDFVYIASHDLQEPLRTVAGYLQMIERRYATKLGPEGDEFIRFSIEGAQRMQALIESLLVYSRVTSSRKEFEAFSLDEALELALQNLAVRVEETHAAIVRSPLPAIRGDRIQMVQVFQNLLSNAIKFAGPQPPRITVEGEATGGVCTVTVRDEGIGFDQRFAERIFKIFRRLRRDTPGTGIGLAVCKKIVERHGGSIEARSKPGEGATFIFRLPTRTFSRGES